MAQEDPNRLAEWIVILRKRLPVAREFFREWVGAVREEPILLWETPAVRYATYGLCLTLVVWLAMFGVKMLVPAPPPSAKPTATTADFHVVCADTECAYHFVIHRTFSFNAFPVDCSKCKRKTGTRARKCNSSNCLGHWVAPDRRENILACPICGGRFE